MKCESCGKDYKWISSFKKKCIDCIYKKQRSDDLKYWLDYLNKNCTNFGTLGYNSVEGYEFFIYGNDLDFFYKNGWEPISIAYNGKYSDCMVVLFKKVVTE